MNILLILDFKTQVIEILFVLPGISTILASHDRASLPSKTVLQQVFLACILEQRLKSIKANIEELLSILLLPDIGWFSIEGFEREAEWDRVVELTIWKLEEAEHAHHLMEEVVVDVLAVVLLKVLGNHVISC